MKSPSDFDFFERLQRGIRKGVLMAFDAHFKAGRSVVIYHKGRIVEALIDGTGKIHRITKDSRKRSKKTGNASRRPEAGKIKRRKA